MRPLLVSLLLLAAAGCGPSAPMTRQFAWQGTVADGAWVRVRNAAGDIEVRRSPDARVTVGADVRTGGRQVTWVRDSAADGVTFCVLFGRDPGATCERGATRVRVDLASRVRRLLSARREGDARVKYVLYVPATARVDVRTVNGALDVRSVMREFRGRTVNGAIRGVSVAGGFDAGTVNGAVDVQLGLEGEGAVALETVNGSVTAELPATLAATVSLATVNGRASSDFALAGEGRRQLRGTVGGGGREVSLKTVNGSVTLRRRAGG